MVKMFTCPRCGGHHLKAIVAMHANITPMDDSNLCCFHFESGQRNDVTSFYCGDCGWKTRNERLVQENVC